MHTRSSERNELKRQLMNGASIQMFGPRRIGKTWVLDHLAKDLRSDGWFVVSLDLQGIKSIEGFLDELCRKLQDEDHDGVKAWNTLKQKVSQMLSDGWEKNPLEAIGNVNSEDFARMLISSLDKSGQNVAILIDEISLFVMELLVRDKNNVSPFLSSLRKLQKDYSSVRWIYTGSIGLDVVARRVRLQGTLVDMKIFELLPFKLKAAQSFFEKLIDDDVVAKPFDVADDDFGYLFAELGWLAPYYIELIANEIRPMAHAKKGQRPLATRIEIDEAFDSLLSPTKRGCFSVWEEHVEKNFEPEEENRIRIILQNCCQAAKGSSEETLLSALKEVEGDCTRRQLMDVLTSLSSVGFLMQGDERWRFCSGLVRRYWLEYQSE